MAVNVTSPDKVKLMLSDLGKPTLRGVKKCPKCGTYNGTRGVSCKNKQCDAVFRDKGERKKQQSIEAVKVITGSTVQVFSVRLRDRGPDYRGFVQLPLVQDMDGNPAETVDVTLLEQNSKCYVETCLRAMVGDTWAGETCCSHVKSAIQCTTCAIPLTLKNSVLNSLNVSNEIKQAIWLLATETTGPLVQRVTKNIMVVKCKANNKQPLGFIHFSFFETGKNRQKPEHKFLCSCRSFKSCRLAAPGAGDDRRRCVHFYACICAFASDEKLAEEFAYYIDLDNRTAEETDESQYICAYIPPTAGDGGTDQQADGGGGDAKVEAQEPMEIVLDKSMLNLFPSSFNNLSGAPKAKKAKRVDQVILADVINDQSLKKSPGKVVGLKSAVCSLRKVPSFSQVDETETGLTFRQWLASVTERINQTMHYQFDGNPDPLVFHVPAPFFQCLQQRISAGQKKKRLPNATTGFVRRDALPLGVFTKYTWHITNVIHVKQIFDTPEMPLDVTRNFIENRDSTYDLYAPPVHDQAELDAGIQKKQPIRPFELRTYLKVGHMLPNQKDPTPFTIEWIPDILPQCHIGELRIKFEYGHQRNGHIEKRCAQEALDGPAPEMNELNNIELHNLQDADLI